jgi:hypothetical protein
VIKSWDSDGRASVTFTLPASVAAVHVAVCGDWNSWSPDADIMEVGGDGFVRIVVLETGRTYRFRYLLDRLRWENDWSADSYVPNAHGSDDSLVDLTGPAGTQPVSPPKAAMIRANTR